MSKNYNSEIGYETLQKDFEVYKKQTPKGVSLAKKKSGIYLQFKTPNKARSQYKCNCAFSIDGMIDAVRKAHKVKEKLSELKSETEFWEWYKSEIEEESRLVNDVITFDKAIQKVENDFWSRLDRRKQKRTKGNPSHEDSWYRAYGCFYKKLPKNKNLNLKDILEVIDAQKKGSSNLGEAVRAMKKLARMNKRKDILEALEEVDITQTIFAKLQSVDLEDFIKWRNKTLGITSALSPTAMIEPRKAWLWVFSTQIVYALRISEVFAIKNLFEPYVTKDGVSIPALNDPTNTNNLIYIGDKTAIGTTVKTGSRIARPQIPPKYPNLIEEFEIKNPIVPDNKPRTKASGSIRRFYAKTAREQLIAWDAPYTQTHADRSLGNINGMQAGIPLEIRAQSMGHTPAMNDSVYKKRQGTQTTIDLLLNSNSNAIDFVTALAEAKKLVKEDESNKEIIARLMSVIYQKDNKTITELL